jgi:hypothetical protein
MLHAYDVTSGDVPTGTVYEATQSSLPQTIEIPDNFDVEAARAELRAARLRGDMEKAAELGFQLNAWWEMNADRSFGPEEQGYNSSPAPDRRSESHLPNGSSSPDWGTDVQISANTDIYPVKIASLSNGDLYAFGVWDDGSNYHGYIRRSVDDGQTWSTYWDGQFASTTTIFSPGILVDNDTLVYWYILDHPASNEMRTWVKVCLPGATDDPIYFGSPTGMFNPVDYRDFHLTTDAPVWGTTEYIYASWIESYGTGPDSTRVMSAVSYENDVSTWELGPTRLRASSGANIYYRGTRTAFGSNTDMMWIVAYLHPNAYPNTYDECVRGWYSDDYGSTWSTDPVNLTPYDNHLDEYDPAIAGSHSNTNWICAATQSDTTLGADRALRNVYSTDDGTNWTETGLIGAHDNFFPDVWVDLNSTGFYITSRQDRSGGDEYIRYMSKDINDPPTGPASINVNDDANTNLSGVYGSAVSYNESTGDAVIAWVSYEGADYSIWFDSEGWTGVEEHPGSVARGGFVNLAPNPTKNTATISYVMQTEGQVNISLYDASGRLVSNLVNEAKSAGTHSTAIESDEIAAGVYFVKVETPDGTGTKTMTIVR